VKIYDQLPEDTRNLIGMWMDAEEHWRWARTDHAWTKLVTSREEALDALRSDFRIAGIASDEATTGVRSE
jgi:hypothetical protein